MKRISINLYSIDELGKEAQQEAIESNRYINVEYTNWYDCEFEDFITIGKTIGITIPNKGISFSGFWSQGDGSTFSSIINALSLINGITQKSWRDYAPKLDFSFDSCPCNEKVLNLIRNGHIECDLRTKKPNRGFWIEYHSEFHIGRSGNRECPNIQNELDKLDIWIEDCLNELNNHLYRSLEEQYQYQTSDEVIMLVFIANNYHFTADGKTAGRLLNLISEENL